MTTFLPSSDLRRPDWFAVTVDDSSFLSSDFRLLRSGKDFFRARATRRLSATEDKFEIVRDFKILSQDKMAYQSLDLSTV